MLFCCGLVSILTSIGIILILGAETWLFFGKVRLVDFLFDTEWTPLFQDKHFGILPLVCGTITVATIAVLIAVPLGLVIAVYLSEFASTRVRRTIKPVLEILAGIPTIVFGYFALLFVTPVLQIILPGLSGFNALSPGLVMGFMILPMVASLSEDALISVPQSMRDAAYALGSTKLQMVWRVLVPAALGGVTAAFILAISRAIGETMIVAIAAGQQPNLSMNPLQPIETMTAYIVQVSLGDTPHGTLEYQTIFAVGSALFCMTLVMNMLSLWVRERYKSVVR